MTLREVMIQTMMDTSKYGYLVRVCPSARTFSIRILADESKTWYEFSLLDKDHEEKVLQLFDEWHFSES